MEAGNYKKAMHHKIIANIAIDEMVSVSEMVDRAKTATVRGLDPISLALC